LTSVSGNDEECNLEEMHQQLSRERRK
jgi:hypothetical protein